MRATAGLHLRAADRHRHLRPAGPGHLPHVRQRDADRPGRLACRSSACASWCGRWARWARPGPSVERPVRDELGDNRGTFLAGRGGWRNPLGQARSRLQRVRWSLSGETLERRYWLVLDRAQDSKPRVQQVLDGVTALSWRFLDKEHNWRATGRPTKAARRSACKACRWRWR